MMIHANEWEPPPPHSLEIKGYNATRAAQGCDGTSAERENPAVVVEEER